MWMVPAIFSSKSMFLVGDADAGILHRKHGPFALSFDRDPYRSPFRRILYGVVHEVEKKAPEVHEVPSHFHGLHAPQGKGD